MLRQRCHGCAALCGCRCSRAERFQHPSRLPAPSDALCIRMYVAPEHSGSGLQSHQGGRTSRRSCLPRTAPSQAAVEDCQGCPRHGTFHSLEARECRILPLGPPAFRDWLGRAPTTAIGWMVCMAGAMRRCVATASSVPFPSYVGRILRMSKKIFFPAPSTASTGRLARQLAPRNLPTTSHRELWPYRGHWDVQSRKQHRFRPWLGALCTEEH